jgi:hypothetical protein
MAMKTVLDSAFALRFRLIAVLILVPGTAERLTAASASIQAAANAYIGQNNPTLNPGQFPKLFVGETGINGGPEIRRSLLRFDLSGQIPSNAQITSVTLQIDVSKEANSGAMDSVFDARRLLRSWTETGVTWNAPSAGQSWQVPGADGQQDSVAFPSSAIFVTVTNSYTFPSTPTLVADVQAWVNNPSTNFGWLLVSEGEGTPKTARVVASREDLDPAARPLLTVQYSLASAPMIITQPTNQSALVGDTVTFNVVASGAPPLAYQWRFNSTNLPGRTTDTLILNNVQINQAGRYTVLVTNIGGSVLSAPANLTLGVAVPVVTITSPANGTRFLPNSDVVLTAQATDPRYPISGVDFVLNSNSIAVFTNVPYSFTLTNAASGTYFLTVFATNSQGTAGVSQPVAFSVGAPDVRITSPTNGDEFPAHAAVTLSASADETNGVITQVEFFLGNTSAGIITSSPYSIVTNLPEGIYPLKAKATDDKGIVGESLEPVTFIVGRPIVFLTTPTNGARFRAHTDIPAAAKVQSEGVVTQAQFFLSVTNLETNLVDVFTSAAPSIILTNVAAGTNGLIVKVADDRGLTALSSNVVFFAFNAPQVSLTAPTNGSRFLLGSGIPLSASIAPLSSPNTTVTFFASGPLTGDTAPPPEPIGSVSAPPYQLVWSPSVPGNYELSASAIDDLGQTRQSGIVRVTVYVSELIPPSIRITKAPANFSHVTTSPLEVRGTARDNIGLDHIEFQLFSGPFLSVFVTNIFAQGTTEWVAEVPLVPGQNAATFRSVDLAGNVSTAITRYFTYNVPGSLQLKTDGGGTIAPNLNDRSLLLGKVYSLQAQAAPGQLFASWEQVRIPTNLVLSTNNPRLSFLLVSNSVLLARFVSNPFPEVAGLYSGLFFATNASDVRLESSGSFALQLGASGAFSGKAILAGRSRALHGKFDRFGQARVVLQGPPAVIFSLTADLTGTSNTITGTVQISSGNNVLVSSLLAEKKNPTSPASSGLFVLRDTNSSPVLTAQVITSGGKVLIQRVTGSQLFILTTTISQQQQIPIYLALNHGTEAIFGWLIFPVANPAAVTGSFFQAKADLAFPIILEVTTQ